MNYEGIMRKKKLGLPFTPKKCKYPTRTKNPEITNEHKHLRNLLRWYYTKYGPTLDL